MHFITDSAHKMRKTIAIFRSFFPEIKPRMHDVLTKMRECGKEGKMQDFPHDCRMVDTYAIIHY